MNSELHERLEYLVNFSSQLIFVSGDSIAQQQRTLEAFVYQQHDDTEIAYLTADENADASDYRRQLCRQLLGQVVGSFVRPLNELLAELNQHDGPILITITQAQHLPDGLLQELWDLVLQSRFAGNKQHLNVLLFGETQWAEQAKQWLPAKNTDTPLLIGSQSVSSDDDTSELDKMIAKRRAEFNDHLAKRAQAGAITVNSRMTSPWFWTGMVLLFVSLFFAIFSWQYGETFSTLFNPIEKQAPVSQVSVPSAQTAVVQESQAGAIPTAVIVEPREATSEPSEEIPSTTDSLLVTDWPTARENLPEVGEAAINETLQDESSASPELTLTTPEPESTATPQIADDSKQDTLAVPSANESIDTVATRQPSDNQWLLDNLSPTDYVIQIAGMKDRALLNDFLNDNALTSLVRVYETQRYGGDWFVIVLSNTYPSLNDARDAITQMPEYPQRSQAFVKSATAVLSEISLEAQ